MHNILDHPSESLETIFWVKILKFSDPDPESFFYPGSWMEKIRIWDPDPQHCFEQFNASLLIQCKDTTGRLGYLVVNVILSI
jgi:hypothetical protein